MAAENCYLHKARNFEPSPGLAGQIPLLLKIIMHDLRMHAHTGTKGSPISENHARESPFGHLQCARFEPAIPRLVTFDLFLIPLPFRTMGPRTLAAAEHYCRALFLATCGQHHGLTRAHRNARIELLRRQFAKIVPRCVATAQRGEVDRWLPRRW